VTQKERKSQISLKKTTRITSNKQLKIWI